MKNSKYWILPGLVTAIVIVILLVSFGSFEGSREENSSVLSQKSNKRKTDTREPAVAGSFYPKDKSELNGNLAFYLENAKSFEVEGKLRILVVPHAGLSYSGNTASWGFKQLEGEDYSRVIILGASHKAHFPHVAIYDRGFWRTPLGEVAIDGEFADSLIDNVNFIADTKNHREEHSLEMELIFLQKVLDDFKIVPILVSDPTGELVSVLAQKIAYNFDDKTLLVISTDLSHYPDYETANLVDRKVVESLVNSDLKEYERTINEIKESRYANLSTAACGHQAIKVALKVAEILGVDDFHEIKYENSGDVTDDKTKVVGYASIGGWSNDVEFVSPQLNDSAKTEALTIAKDTLYSHILGQSISSATPSSSILYEPLGAFVTLEKHEELRGCMGLFEPDEPLYEVIQRQTIVAATQDKRFNPVSETELDDIKIEISVMTPRRKISNWQDIEVGKHGVVIRSEESGGTFLPQVATDNDWGLEKFLGELCSQKVKLEADCYKENEVDIYTFEVQIFGE
jgi:AmmeMemoRadiSam system protein B/AmmeMemoRadiSam system protein A